MALKVFTPSVKFCVQYLTGNNSNSLEKRDYFSLAIGLICKRLNLADFSRADLDHGENKTDREP